MSEEAVVSTAPVAETIATIGAEATEPKAEVKPTETPESKPVLTAEELQKKFDRDAAHQRRKHERELQAEREQRIRLEERLAQHKPARDAEPGEPTIDQFESFDEFVTAKAKFIAAKEIAAERAEYEKKQAEERSAAEKKKTADAWHKRIESVDIPDFHEVMNNSEAMISGIMEQAILESDNGPKLAYHLATNPEIAEQISRMTPVGAVRALTLIEEGFKKPVAVSKATPPITPVGSKATSIKSLMDVSDFDEFTKRREAQIAKRR